MAVLYETTNIIDIYIENKPVCNSWNGGWAAMGIQNDAGTEAVVPPGRNGFDSPWEAQNEAWRFIPTGTSIVDFSWLDSSGNVISTNPQVEVSPTVDSQYFARVEYVTCTGNNYEIISDPVNVSVDVPIFSVDIGGDLNLCTDAAPTVLDADIGSTTASYQWQLNATDISGETSPTLTVNSPDNGVYSVIVEDLGCTGYDEITISYGQDDSSFELIPTCDGATVSNIVTPGGTFSFDQPPTDGAVIDSVTGEISNGTVETTYYVNYLTNDICPTESVVSVQTLSLIHI